MSAKIEDPCPLYAVLIRAYAFGDQAYAVEAKQHIGHCKACRIYYQQQQELAHTLLAAVPTFIEPVQIKRNLLQRLKAYLIHMTALGKYRLT